METKCQTYRSLSDDRPDKRQVFINDHQRRAQKHIDTITRIIDRGRKELRRKYRIGVEADLERLKDDSAMNSYSLEYVSLFLNLIAKKCHVYRW